MNVIRVKNCYNFCNYDFIKLEKRVEPRWITIFHEMDNLLLVFVWVNVVDCQLIMIREVTCRTRKTFLKRSKTFVSEFLEFFEEMFPRNVIDIFNYTSLCYPYPKGYITRNYLYQVKIFEILFFRRI